jgi:hypothetical protein
MSDGGSMVEFFYNLVPGSLFLLFLQYYYKIDLLLFFPKISATDSFTILIFVYIVYSLFLGFIFQSFTKFVRDKCGVNNFVANQVLHHNEKNSVKLPKKIRTGYTRTKYNTLTTFYLLDNHLRGKQAAFMPTHNSSLFAFWSNIFFATLLIVVLRLIKTPRLSSDYLLFIYALIHAGYFSYKYLYTFYDTILKSYYMEIKK